MVGPFWAQSTCRTMVLRSHADSMVESQCAALPITERHPSGSVGIKCALITVGECGLYTHPASYIGDAGHVRE